MSAAACAVRAFQAVADVGWRGRMVYRFLYGLLKLVQPRRERIDANLRLVWPERDAAWRRAFRARVYQNLAWTVTEVLALQRDPGQASSWISGVEGRSILDELAEGGQGAILLTGHFGNWELLGTWYAQVLKAKSRQLYAVFQEIHDRDLSGVLKGFRERGGISVLPKEMSVLEMAHRLRAGAHIAILADVSWLEGALTMPFMGHECTNSPGPAILAMLASVPIVPLGIYRRGPFEHGVRVFPPLSIPGQGSRAERIEGGTLAINRALEAIIAPRPELWFWLHDRWKSRPLSRQTVVKDGAAEKSPVCPV